MIVSLKGIRRFFREEETMFCVNNEHPNNAEFPIEVIKKRIPVFHSSNS